MARTAIFLGLGLGLVEANQYNVLFPLYNAPANCAPPISAIRSCLLSSVRAEIEDASPPCPCQAPGGTNCPADTPPFSLRHASWPLLQLVTHWLGLPFVFLPPHTQSICVPGGTAADAANVNCNPQARAAAPSGPTSRRTASRTSRRTSSMVSSRTAPSGPTRGG